MQLWRTKRRQVFKYKSLQRRQRGQPSVAAAAATSKPCNDVQGPSFIDGLIRSKQVDLLARGPKQRHASGYSQTSSLDAQIAGKPSKYEVISKSIQHAPVVNTPSHAGFDNLIAYCRHPTRDPLAIANSA